MARLARVVVPGVPHHVTQRGNRRLETFFEDDDYRAYLDLLAASCAEAGVAVWAYCLMPNHVHLVLVPDERDGLRHALGEAHRRYTRRINFREGWRGHLWQERFHSFPMDEAYLLATARYVELNPLRARLVRKPGAGRAPAPIWPGATTPWSKSHRCAAGSPTGPASWPAAWRRTRSSRSASTAAAAAPGHEALRRTPGAPPRPASIASKAGPEAEGSGSRLGK